MAITVQLFYVPQKSLVDFQIHPLESHERILQNIRQRFDVALIEVYTQDAKRQPVNLNLSYAPVGFKLYRGEETGFIHPSLQGKPWNELNEIERKSHIVSLGARKPETKNTHRITEPYPAISIDLYQLEQTIQMHVMDKYSLRASYDKIFRNWGLNFTMWLPEEMKPKESLKKYEWDLSMVASIAILSKATPGQGHIIRDILKNIMEAQGALRVPTQQVVLQTIDYVYEKAGLIATSMKQAEKEKIKEKGRQRHRRERKKAAGKKKAGEEEMKELGEEAAEAADPRGLWMKEPVSDMEDLTKKLEGTRTSHPARRIVLDDSESD